jgi:hypothetical protein
MFWWGWKVDTVLEAFCFSNYIWFGLALQFFLPRFRWIVRAVLVLTVLFVTPQALFPPPFESSTRFWCLRAMLVCCVYLLIATRHPSGKERPSIG